MKRLFIGASAAVIMACTLTSGREATTCCGEASNVADTITLPGGRWLGSDMKVTVAVPDGYRCEGDTARYPVVYLLNGHGGNYRNWGRIVDLEALATEFGCILVCPSGMNSWYWDSPVKPDMQMESFFVESLIPSIDSLYRTIPDRSQRAITGFSMGGHGALWLAIRHDDLFGSAGATSGGVNIIPFPKNWNMPDMLGAYSDNKARWESHTVANILDSIKPGRLNIIFDCGTDDFFYKVNCQLDSALNARKIHHTFITNPGAHTGDYWSRSLRPHLEFFKDKR